MLKQRTSVTFSYIALPFLFTAMYDSDAKAFFGSLTGAHSTCSSTHERFIPMWSCIKARIAAGTAGMMNNDMGVRYVAVGDALAQQVRGRKLTDVDAKAHLAGELVRGNSEFERRKARVLGGSVFCSRVGYSVTCY